MLIEIGFLGADSKKYEEAETIFNGVIGYQPGVAYPHIGTAHLAILKGDLQNAINILRNTPCKDDFQKEYRNGYLAMVLKMVGYTQESNAILTEIKENGQDQRAVKLATKLLEMDFNNT